MAAPIDPEPSASAPGFFPAITFFTDAVTALPKEMQKHFTILKETEGKLYQPDQAVNDIVNSINKLPDPPRMSTLRRNQAYMHLSVADSISGSATGSVVNRMTPRRLLSASDVENQPPNVVMPLQDHEAQREELFVQLITKLKEMAAILDEKNMILSASNDTLNRQLMRFDSVMPHVENEISEETRLGSNTHWALPHMKDLRRTNGVTSDRGRRDVTNVNNLAAAAAAVHEGEIAATRSEARREAMLAKRGRARDPDSDADERPHARKHVASKARKVPEITVDAKSTASSQPAKRRRVEKLVAGERAMGAALSGRLAPARASPRGSPAPDGNRKKAKPLPAQNASKKKYTKVRTQEGNNVADHFSRAPHNPSSIGSSPTRGNAITNRNHSPARQPTSKAHQPYLRNLLNENSNSRRPSSTSSNKKGITVVENSSGAIGRLPQEEIVAEGKDVEARNAGDQVITQSAQGTNGGTKRRESNKTERPDPTELNQLPQTEDVPPPPPGRHSRAASRSSKPATPLTTTMDELPHAPRPRSTRNGANGSHAFGSGPSSPRRSHKKGVNGGILMAPESTGSSDEEDAEIRTLKKPALKEGGDAAVDTAGEEIDENDENEPRYCTCNRVSFGNMIACDNASCLVEWFHLECVDLDRAPIGRWFCSDQCRREATTRRGR